MKEKVLLSLFTSLAVGYYASVSSSPSSSVAAITILSFAVQPLLYLAYHSFIHRWYVSSTKRLPSPQGTKFLGNLGPFLKEPWGFPLARWQLGIPSTPSGFYRVFLGPFDYLIPKSAKAVTAVMSQPYVFKKPGPVRDGLIATLGVGLVSSEDDVHRKQKKLLTPIFGLERNRRLVPQMWHKSIVLRDEMERLVANAGGSDILAMHPLTMAATLDVIGVTTLGIDFDSVRQPSQPILEAYKAVFPVVENQSELSKFLTATLPAVISPKILFKLPFKKLKQFHWGIKVLRQFCIDQIRTKKEKVLMAGADENTAQNDILSSIIAAGLTDEGELTSHLLTILAAGHESTAITLAWALLKLAQHPEVQSRLREEVTSFTADEFTPPTLEAINSASYLRAFLMEVLRLYPAFPAMMREASRNTVVDGGLVIPRGKPIMVSPWAINRSVDLWGPDAGEFHIERWERSHSGGATSSQAFMTFSSGPRVCVGKDFAMLSLKVFLVVLVSRFRFEEAVPGVEPEIQKGTSLKPRDLRLKVSLIE